MLNRIPVIFCCLMAQAISGCSYIVDTHAKPDGEWLYKNNCARCHGNDAMGTDVGTDQAPAIQGRSIADIRNAIDTNTEMKFLQESKFTDEQLEAISDYLLQLLQNTSSLYTVDTLAGSVYTGGDAQALTITVRDAHGLQLVTAPDPQGAYRIYTAGLTPPFLIAASLDNGAVITSHGSGTGFVGISPLTDFIVRNSGAFTAQQLLTCGAACNLDVSLEQLQHGQRVFTQHFLSRLTAAAIAPERFKAFQSLVNAPDNGPLIADLMANRISFCGNPLNPLGLRYDDDQNGDCYHDNDQDQDGFGDDDTNRDGLPG